MRTGHEVPSVQPWVKGHPGWMASAERMWIGILFARLLAPWRDVNGRRGMDLEVPMCTRPGGTLVGPLGPKGHRVRVLMYTILVPPWWDCWISGGHVFVWAGDCLERYLELLCMSAPCSQLHYQNAGVTQRVPLISTSYPRMNSSCCPAIWWVL